MVAGAVVKLGPSGFSVGSLSRRGLRIAFQEKNRRKSMAFPAKIRLKSRTAGEPTHTKP